MTVGGAERRERSQTSANVHIAHDADLDPVGRLGQRDWSRPDRCRSGDVRRGETRRRPLDPPLGLPDGRREVLRAGALVDRHLAVCASDPLAPIYSPLLELFENTSLEGLDFFGDVSRSGCSETVRFDRAFSAEGDGYERWPHKMKITRMQLTFAGLLVSRRFGERCTCTLLPGKLGGLITQPLFISSVVLEACCIQEGRRPEKCVECVQRAEVTLSEGRDAGARSRGERRGT